LKAKKITRVLNITEIIDRCKSGDQQAEFALFKEFERPVYNSCYRIVNDRETALDMLQEVFVKAFDNLYKYEPTFKFYTWLNRIAINHCLNFVQKKGIAYQLSDDISQFESAYQEEDFDDVELEVKRVSDAIQQLPDGYRTVLSLYLMEGYDHGEISEILNISESTSKSQYARAKGKLKDILKEEA